MSDLEEEYDVIALVSNDITTDRRMIRTCTTLASTGWKVLLVGRIMPNSQELPSYPFETMRLSCSCQSGPLFYLEILWRFRKVLSRLRFSRLLCTDLDTIGIVNLIDTRDIKVYFDAHEFFTEVPELKRSFIKKGIWTKWGRKAMCKVATAYTVGPELARILGKKYGRHFDIVRNVPESQAKQELPQKERVVNVLSLVYLGVLNPGRGLEVLIQVVLKRTDLELTIVGDGPLLNALKTLAENNTRIHFMGQQSPSKLVHILRDADVGVNLLEGTSLSYYYSLANKFFDYLHAGLPVLCMDFPEYRSIAKTYDCIYAVETLDFAAVNRALEAIDKNSQIYRTKKQQCLLAAEAFNWENEAVKLLELFYAK